MGNRSVPTYLRSSSTSGRFAWVAKTTFHSFVDSATAPRIRQIEARYLAFALRRALAGTGEWGAVRVVADDSVIEELVIRGEIVQLDARKLGIRIRAVDASGVTWIDEWFSAPHDPKLPRATDRRGFARRRVRP